MAGSDPTFSTASWPGVALSGWFSKYFPGTARERSQSRNQNDSIPVYPSVTRLGVKVSRRSPKLMTWIIFSAEDFYFVNSSLGHGFGGAVPAKSPKRLQYSLWYGAGATRCSSPSSAADQMQIRIDILSKDIIECFEAADELTISPPNCECPIMRCRLPNSSRLLRIV